jgi:hypothetical protein
MTSQPNRPRAELFLTVVNIFDFSYQKAYPVMTRNARINKKIVYIELLKRQAR